MLMNKLIKKNVIFEMMISFAFKKSLLLCSEEGKKIMLHNVFLMIVMMTHGKSFIIFTARVLLPSN